MAYLSTRQSFLHIPGIELSTISDLRLGLIFHTMAGGVILLSNTAVQFSSFPLKFVSHERIFPQLEDHCKGTTGNLAC